MFAETLEITDERRNQRVPNFTLRATNGLDVTLYKFAGRKRALLYFPVSLDDDASKLFARNLAVLREELEDADAIFLPIVNGDENAARAWGNENARGYSVLMDADARVRKNFFEYFEIDASSVDASPVDTTHALFVLLTLYCAPLVISHAANALQLMPPREIMQWLNVLVCACSE